MVKRLQNVHYSFQKVMRFFNVTQTCNLIFVFLFSDYGILCNQSETTGNQNESGLNRRNILSRKPEHLLWLNITVQ